MAAAGLPPVATALLWWPTPKPARKAAPPAVLREAFGLTRAEAGVAARAANGEGVPALAASLGISPGTARLHLHRVFEKTGAHRQAELAAVLGRPRSVGAPVRGRRTRPTARVRRAVG
jgi:DNA-binding CsgD family transcriptional regulator